MSLFTALVPFSIGCTAQPEKQPSTLIFSGVERIDLISPLNGDDLSDSGGNFEFNLPSEVEYAVLVVFSATIETSGNTIINDEAEFLAGSRSGLPGFSRDQVNQNNLYTYNPATNDFSGIAYGPAGTNRWWAVYGYDSEGELTHASPQREFDF